MGSAFFAVGAKERPLLSRSICVLVSCVSERLTILSAAHS